MENAQRQSIVLQTWGTHRRLSSIDKKKTTSLSIFKNAPGEIFFLFFLFVFHFYIKTQSCFEKPPRPQESQVSKENLATLLFLFQVRFVMQPARSHQANWLHFSFLASVPTSVSPFHFLVQPSLCSEFTLKCVWAFAAHAWNVKPVMFSLRRAPSCFFKSVGSGSHLLHPFLSFCLKAHRVSWKPVRVRQRCDAAAAAS